MAPSAPSLQLTTRPIDQRTAMTPILILTPEAIGPDHAMLLWPLPGVVDGRPRD